MTMSRTTTFNIEPNFLQNKNRINSSDVTEFMRRVILIVVYFCNCFYFGFDTALFRVNDVYYRNVCRLYFDGLNLLYHGLFRHLDYFSNYSVEQKRFEQEHLYVLSLTALMLLK